MMPANILQVLQVHELERRENIRVENIERSMLRDAADPFALRDEVFIATFRLTKDMVRYVADQVHPYLQRNNVRAIPSMTKLLSALSFFATGSYQRTVGQNFNFPMCQATISNIVNEVSLAIVVTMGEEWVQFPRTADEKNAIKQVFLENCNFPGTIGAIDCTHVALIAPRIEEHNYLNRKGYHSKNVQIICDYGLKILNVNAIYAGATHDSFIWRNSAIQQQMQISYNLGEINSWLVGDSGYPQQNWLMTPIVDAVPGTPAFAYSEGQMRARNCVERCIGVLKGRFRCIMGERKLRYEPEKVGNIVNTCAILHNICVAGRLNIEPAEPHGINNVIQGPQLRGNQARQELINRLRSELLLTEDFYILRRFASKDIMWKVLN